MSAGPLREASDDAQLVGKGVEFELPPTRPTDRLDNAIDLLEQVMPDMSVLGALMLLLFAYLVASGSNLGATEEVLGAMNDAAAAASASGNYVAF